VGASDSVRIFTLEARTNVFLEAMRDHLSLSGGAVFRVIEESFSDLRGLLAQKGIDYSNLKRALVPDPKREEWGFLFDWALSLDPAYGREAMHALLPLLGDQSTHSVLCGDWLFKERFSKVAAALPRAHIPPSLSSKSDGGDTVFIIYLNNLKPASARRITDGLSRSSANYLGAVNLTYSSALKTILARSLVRVFIKHRRLVVQGVEDDRPTNDDTSLLSYEFYRFGLQNRNVPGWLYGIFLSYKIESPPLPGERDAEFALNALCDHPVSLSECRIELEERKLEYLREQKKGSLRRAGLEGLGRDEVVERIRGKLESNYVYNLSRSRDGRTLKVNVILEVADAIRSLVALEYCPGQREVRVITFY